jgi:peptidoglycan/xylan/chitin deacetylase (PgdA/CDA1 family)
MLHSLILAGGALLFIFIPALVALWVLRCFVSEYRRDRVPILLYHRFIRKADADAGRVPDNEMMWVCYDTRFAEQMAYLHEHGYTTLHFDDYLRIRLGQAPLPPKPIIITMDDGYLSNYEIAYPVLKKYGQKATIFVAPEPDEHTRRLVAGVDGFLSPEQMREIDANGVAIESHTLTHCVLADLNDETARYELTESRRRLAEILGRAVAHIAIPRAGYSRRIARLVREAGYRTACCNNKGSATARSDLLALPRFVIERDMTLEEFARALTPRSAVMLRIVGNIKRMPVSIFGVQRTQMLRRWLYFGPLRGLFVTRRLKRIVVGFAAVYLFGCAAFVWYLVQR